MKSLDMIVPEITDSVSFVLNLLPSPMELLNPEMEGMEDVVSTADR